LQDFGLYCPRPVPSLREEEVRGGGHSPAIPRPPCKGGGNNYPPKHKPTPTATCEPLKGEAHCPVVLNGGHMCCFVEADSKPML